MPTFLERRYMRPRERVSSREKASGGIVLLIAAAVVVACVVVMTYESAPLFEIAPGNERVSPDRALLVAQRMMPALGTAGWSDVRALQVDPSDVPAAYGVEQVFVGRYENLADAAQQVRVTIYDAGAPENAFGLFIASRPAEWGPLAVGCGGWRTQAGGGFWAGRHYTEFDRSTVTESDPTVQAIADALAGVQLRYGLPFWAELVLPASDRVPGSFRYVAHGAVGWDFLDRAFLADYGSGVTAFVTEPGSAARASDLMDRFEAFLSSEGRVQSRPGGPDSPLLAGDFDGRQVAVFAAGPRVYGVVGSDMAVVSQMAWALVADAGVTGPTSVESTVAEAADGSLLPSVDLPGWGDAAGLRVYTPEDLWEKINGRADLYLAFHMARMVFGTYSDSRDPGRFIDVYWYDMGAPDNAFGIYRAEMSSEPRSIDVGREGYATPGGVFFWKGGSYVRVEASDGSEELADAALAVARAVAKAVPDEERRLWADDLLPAEDRVAGSFGYEATDAFSLGFLNDVFRAEYRAGDVAYTTFVHRAKDAAAARATFEAYAAFFQEHGRLIRRETREGFDLVVGEVGGVVDAVVVVGSYLGGVSGSNDATLSEEKAIAFARTLLSRAN